MYALRRDFALYVWSLKNAFNELDRIKGVVIKKVAIPILILVALDLIAVAYPGDLIALMASAISYPFYILIAVAVHRLILLGENARAGSWTWVEMRFLWNSIGITLLVSILAVVLIVPATLAGNAEFLSWIYSIFVGILVAWVYSRLVIVLPTIAIQRDFSFKEAWRLGEDYQVLLFLACVIGPALLSLLIYPLPFVLSSLAYSLILIFNVAVLSCCFRLMVHDTAD